MSETFRYQTMTVRFRISKEMMDRIESGGLGPVLRDVFRRDLQHQSLRVSVSLARMYGANVTAALTALFRFRKRHPELRLAGPKGRLP